MLTIDNIDRLGGCPYFVALVVGTMDGEDDSGR